MKDTQIQNAVNSILSGLEVSADAKDQLLQNTLSPNTTSKRSLSRKIVFTVVFALVITSMLASAVGIPMLQIFRSWTDDVYATRVDIEKPMPGVFEAEPQPEEVAQLWGQDIADALYDMNACVHLPKWKPEPYYIETSRSIEWDETFGGRIHVAFQTYDGRDLGLTITVYPSDGNLSITTLTQHDNTENKVWKYGGIEYIYLNNLGARSVHWQEENCDARFYGDLTKEELHKMVKSIYE